MRLISQTVKFIAIFSSQKGNNTQKANHIFMTIRSLCYFQLVLFPTYYSRFPMNELFALFFSFPSLKFYSPCKKFFTF